MIRFQNITKIYSSQKATLDNISINIKKGEFVSITGKSGAGKTTLIKLLLGEDKPTRGRIFFEDIDVQKIKSRFLPRYRRNFGIIFQDYKLLEYKTCYENIAFAMEVMGEFEEKIKRDVFHVLELVDMADKADSYPKELSGGEEQRVAIARALIHRPRTVIADEPTGNLDPYHSWDIIRLLVKIHEFGTTTILASHNKEIINYLQKRVITLNDGKIARDEEKGRFML